MNPVLLFGIINLTWKDVINMKNVFIIGARGYHASYGGWETFVSNLVDHYKDKNVKFYISMYTDDKNENIRNINDNIMVFPIYVKNKGSATMFFYSIKAFKYCIKYVKENHIEASYLYVLGLKLFHYLWLYENRLKALNVTTLVNPDGLEHERSKWSYPVKKFFLLSERLMLKHTDMIICDAKGIKKYVDNKYPQLSNRTKYIAYGSESYDFSLIDEKKVLKEYGLNKGNYCLMVGRCVPENNYELVIEEFMNSNIQKDLIIITNLSRSSYYQELIDKTNCIQDKRIRFIDGVYDKEKLAVIRKNAYLYIHGHSVGGTNPSLIEALSLTDLNLLYDVCFNHDVGEYACLYFKEKGSLVTLLNDQKFLDHKRKMLGKEAKEIVERNFTWDKIVSQYQKIFQ